MAFAWKLIAMLGLLTACSDNALTGGGSKASHDDDSTETSTLPPLSEDATAQASDGADGVVDGSDGDVEIPKLADEPARLLRSECKPLGVPFSSTRPSYRYAYCGFFNLKDMNVGPTQPLVKNAPNICTGGEVKNVQGTIKTYANVWVKGANATVTAQLVQLAKSKNQVRVCGYSNTDPTQCFEGCAIPIDVLDER